MTDSDRPRDATEPSDSFVSINEACRRFGLSRRTFYRMLSDPSGGLTALVIRVPRGSGHIRVPVRRFEAWLRARPRRGPRGTSPETLGESGRTGGVLAHPTGPDHKAPE